MIFPFVAFVLIVAHNMNFCQQKRIVIISFTHAVTEFDFHNGYIYFNFKQQGKLLYEERLHAVNCGFAVRLPVRQFL